MILPSPSPRYSPTSPSFIPASPRCKHLHLSYLLLLNIFSQTSKQVLHLLSFTDRRIYSSTLTN
jgi:hypothetical protein